MLLKEHLLKGNEFYYKEEYEKSIEYFDKALEIDPKYADAWNNKGAALIRLEKYNEAIECCDKAINIDPNNANAWCNKGIALSCLWPPRFDEAILCYDMAIEIDPSYSKNEVANALETIYKKGEKKRKARIKLLFCDKALEIDPKNVGAWNNKGLALNNLGKYNEAIECLDKALEIPKYVLAMKNKDIIVKRMGKQPDKIGTIMGKKVKWYTSDGKPVYE